MSGLMRDGTAEPVSRDHALRRKLGQEADSSVAVGHIIMSLFVDVS